MRKRSLIEFAAVGALVAVTLVASWFTRSVVQDEMHRQRVQAAQRLSLEIDGRLQKGLAAEEGVYGLSNGLPNFSGEQFSSFGRTLIRRHGFSYVGWAPAVNADKQGTFEQQHGVKITGASTMAGGTLVPVLYFAQSESGQSAEVRPGLNLLSSPGIRPALLESEQRQNPAISGDARVNGAAGVVLLQPMFARDATGEWIAGWVVAGIGAERLVGDSQTFLPRGAVVRVALGGATLFGSGRAADAEDIVTTSVGRSNWKISVMGVGNGFSLLAPWIVLAIGLALTTLIALLFRQEARLDRARRAELARLAEAALVDSLTGLRNHRAFEEDLARELQRQSRSGRVLSLVMLDVENLKTVNDTLGHQEGDERLKSLAHALRRAARASDAAYRLGGDEFALLLPETNAWGSFQFVQRLQASLAASPVDTRVSVAAGVADTIGLETRDSVIRRASLALLEAKRSDRGVLVYSEEFEPAVRELDEESEEQHKRTLATALAQAVDAKDSGTRSHCETVSLLCVLIAEELGFEPRRIAELRLAGLLHDVGKIGIPDAILQKPAKLADEEFEVMKTHSALGHSIVKAAGREQEAYWILHHHERPDGRGYPDGLRGDEVPLESRIILVGDAFEAITADRPYRKQASVAEALAELERHAGTQFDPQCVAALRDAISRGSALSSESLTAVAMDAA